MSDTLEILYLLYDPEVSTQVSPVFIDCDARTRVSALAKAIGDEMRPQVAVPNILLWKPKEPLPAKDEAGKEAMDTLLGKLTGPEAHNLNAIATELDSLGNLKTLFGNKDVQRNEVTEDAQRNDEVKLVDVIVQLYPPSRKRHSTENKPEDPRRPKIGTGGSSKLGGVMWYLPITEKETEQGGNELYHFGVTKMQGWRPGMEDMHTVSLHVGEERANSNAFFAVYDGHGGTAAARYAHENLHKRLAEDPAYRNQEYSMALKNAFLSTDEGMRNSSDFQEGPHKQSGCTAISALFTKNSKILVANAGDSRAVLSVKGMAKKLSVDHKPWNSIERSRIKAAGGRVWIETIKSASGDLSMERVNGDLSLTRALGDFRYKNNALLPPEAQIITADPEIIEHDITDDNEFLVVACDGIWECLGSQKVVNAVRLLVSEGNELGEVCERICNLCLAPNTRDYDYGFDNMTIIVVALLHGRTIDEWYEWISDRTRRGFGYNTPTVLPRLHRR